MLTHQSPSTGASKTIVYLDRVRNKGSREGESMSTAQSPSIGVHTDLTHASSRYSLHNIGYSPEEIEHLLKFRHVVVNVWRPIKQIRRDPLAIYDWRTVNPETDIFNDRRVLSDGILEFGRPVFSERHEWFYLSGQRLDEPLIFKQLDTNLEANITLPHSAFVDPKYVDYPPRESIEFKDFAFFED